MLLVDRVLTLTPRVHGVGIKAVTGNEYGLARRSHGFVFPATLALDALAQLGTLVMVYPTDGDIQPLEGPPPPGRALGTIAAVQSVEMQREMVDPDILQLNVTVLSSNEDTATVRGEVSLGGTLFVSATLDLVLRAR